MTEKRFSLAEALRFGIYMVFEHFGLFLAVIFTYLGVMALATLVFFALAWLPFMGLIIQSVKMSGVDAITSNFVGSILNQVGYGFSLTCLLAIFGIYLVNRYLKLGLTKVSFELYDKNNSSWDTLFSCYSLIMKDAIASCLYFFIGFIGLFLLIVPGIYWGITYGFYHQFIVDKQVGIVDAFKKSAEITRGAKWELFSLSILFFFIRVVSLKFFGLTILLVWPFFSLVTVYIYRRLLNRTVIV